MLSTVHRSPPFPECMVPLTRANKAELSLCLHCIAGHAFTCMAKLDPQTQIFYSNENNQGACCLDSTNFSLQGWAHYYGVCTQHSLFCPSSFPIFILTSSASSRHMHLMFRYGSSASACSSSLKDEQEVDKGFRLLWGLWVCFPKALNEWNFYGMYRLKLCVKI